MFNPCFKNMDCIMDYIGKNQVGTLIEQYDDLITMPLLKVVMGFLNLGQITSPNPPTPKQLSTSLTSFGLFKSVPSTQKDIEGLLKLTLSLFCRFHVENVDGLDPLL